jgi:hypothetical protein
MQAATGVDGVLDSAIEYYLDEESDESEENEIEEDEDY